MPISTTGGPRATQLRCRVTDIRWRHENLLILSYESTTSGSRQNSRLSGAPRQTVRLSLCCAYTRVGARLQKQMNEEGV